MWTYDILYGSKPRGRAARGAFVECGQRASVGVRKMADGDIDLYADDLEQDFAQVIQKIARKSYNI